MKPPLQRLTTLGAVLALGMGALYARPAAARLAHVAGARHAAPAVARDSITPAARAQLAAARRATAALATPEAAREAGYRPMFGNVPLQGEHYVRVDLVLGGAFDVERPSVLMFAPVNGEQTLVGAAYAFMHPRDAALPTGFDGPADEWHAHDRLANVPGKRLVMTHAWFVDAPAGPFARYNTSLPYVAVGLAPPSAAVLADSVAGGRARRLGLALAAAHTPPLIFEWLERNRGDALRARTAPHRAAIRATVPRIAAAERAGDAAARTRLADEAIRHGEALVASYREASPDRPLVARLVARTVDEFMGRGHGIEEELGALFGGGAGRADAPPHPKHEH